MGVKDFAHVSRIGDRFRKQRAIVLTCKDVKVFTLGTAQVIYSSTMSARKRESREVGVGCEAQCLKSQLEAQTLRILIFLASSNTTKGNFVQSRKWISFM
jgi:hypothetical protein